MDSLLRENEDGSTISIDTVLRGVEAKSVDSGGELFPVPLLFLLPLLLLLCGVAAGSDGGVGVGGRGDGTDESPTAIGFTPAAAVVVTAAAAAAAALAAAPLSTCVSSAIMLCDDDTVDDDGGDGDGGDGGAVTIVPSFGTTQ